MNQFKSLIVAVAILAGMLAAGAIVGVATHSQENTQDGFKVNSQNATTGEVNIPNPGQRQTVEGYLVPSRMGEPDPTGEPSTIPPSVEIRADYLRLHAAQSLDCTVSDAKTAGFDRGNDDPGRKTDQSVVNSLKEQQFVKEGVGPEDDPGPMAPDGWDFRMQVNLDLFGPNDFAGDPAFVNTNGTEDEVVLALSECVENPTTSGWFRAWMFVNGTVVEVHDDQYADQFQKGQKVENWEASQWYPVCECEDIRHIPMTIGPPPSGHKVAKDGDGSRFFANGTLYVATGSIASDGTADFQGTTVSADQVTSEGVQFDDGTMPLDGPVYFGDMQGSEGTIREDGTVVAADGTEYPPEDQGSAPDDGGDATPTATSEDGSTDDGTPAGTDDGTDGSTDGEVAGTETNDGTGGMTTATDAPANDGGEQTDGGETTPTADDGAGLGVGAAALAALVVSFVALRRNR